MSERTTLEKIAATVDEAVEEGLQELGLSREAVEVEVLDGGSRGLFGVGSRQARVRLSVREILPERKSGEAEARRSESRVSETRATYGEPDALLTSTRELVVELLAKMKVQATVETAYGEPDEQDERPLLVEIRGNDLGVLIGRRAEILNALQYIVNLIVSKQAEQWVQVVVDVEGYRARRERQLRQLARRMADQALKTGRRQVLEPMSANERRIIHLELREYEGVLTQSVGEEPGRKVTIVPK
jgi:spoIIIJ-associated protein